jgi:predicted metal-dependent peptidase
MDPDEASRAVHAAKRAISLVCVSLPHLSGLAHSIRIAADERVGTAGIFASGRLVVKPEWFLQFTDGERAFVIAHELLHLALHSHARGGDVDPNKFNVAHDLIINDILETELGIQPPGGGVRRPGARHTSAEALMLDPSLPTHGSMPDTAMGAAIRDALGLGGLRASPEDVLDAGLEAEWFPDETPQARAAATAATHGEATKALALQQIQERARQAAQQVSQQTSGFGHGMGNDAYVSSAYVDALNITYRPPWELALHRWLDAVTTPVRTYARASRRSGGRTDIVLPGRIRDAQTISIVLDTSGSMTGEIAHALGSIMAFGRGANIETVRIVQCDTSVTSDEIVVIDDLATYRVTGFGGSDMTPAMKHLANDPETTAVVVITDGAIDYPQEPMPYHVLWVVYDPYAGYDSFTPGYGQVVIMNVDAT